MSRSSRPKPGPAKYSSRRADLRRNLPRSAPGLRTILQRPETVSAGLVLLGFIFVTGLSVSWAREQLRFGLDQIMLDTRLNRVSFEVIDDDATDAKREEARNASPLIYRVNDAYLEEITHALVGLPTAVEAKSSLTEVNPELIRQFRMTDDGLAALQAYAAEGGTTATWERWVTNLATELSRRTPILRSEEFQRYSLTRYHALLRPDAPLEALGDGITPIELTEGVQERFDAVVRRAGFPAPIAPLIQSRLNWQTRPTFLFDPESTKRVADLAADQVRPVRVPHRKGEIIYREGDRLDSTAYELARTEAVEFREQSGFRDLWLPRIGVFGLIAVLGLFAGSFIVTTYPRILRNWLRLTSICVLMAGLLAAGAILACNFPSLLFPAAVGSTLFVTIILLLAYDHRLALLLSIVQCALMTLALKQDAGWFILLMAGCGSMIAQLREVRHRNSLIRAAIITAMVLGAGTLLHGIMASPSVEGIFVQIVTNAAWSVGASVVVGFLVLGILPSIERLFDITTGMTLAELRDPSQPLLRQLQQRAPGTYNHSLQVANISEAAADAIGADSLLVYVGALYHDCGKMNKPDYFVENQSDGFNKHSKLRPAMSLLVIIGHVKDGIELAREYGLPRSIQHFIEAHHGTTLVEYFYHAAKEKAEAEAAAGKEGTTAPKEVEFRYPGPKPRTKEAAIMLLADAVESATRAMSEPHPSRIESLVRDLSRKRLLDGQFDESTLTFRELGQIEDAMIQRLCAIHHSRISYPSTARLEDEKPEGGSGRTRRVGTA